MQAELSQHRKRVRVWFGDGVICSHVASEERARRYASLIAQRFAGLRVTIDDGPDERDAELPHELLWDRTIS
jgi:hypothetical protein